MTSSRFYSAAALYEILPERSTTAAWPGMRVNRCWEISERDMEDRTTRWGRSSAPHRGGTAPKCHIQDLSSVYTRFIERDEVQNLRSGAAEYGSDGHRTLPVTCRV